MAKLEIPSIVVQSGSHTPPVMDRATTRTQWSLSTQSTYEDEGDLGVQPTIGEAERFLPCTGDKENEASENKLTNNNNIPRTRSKANLKLLKRSHALKESTSPPPDVPLSPVATSPTTELPTSPSNNNNPAAMNSNGSLRPILKRDNSDQSSDSNWSSPLSRGNSMEQKGEHVPFNFEQCITEAINRNCSDRSFLVQVENDLDSLLKDKRRKSFKFTNLTTYLRMLIHRIADYYGMEHKTDMNRQAVIVTKVKNSKEPPKKLTSFIRGVPAMTEEPRKSILKRNSSSFEDTASFKTPDGHLDAPPRSKSFEEREEEYEKARARIFQQEHGDQAQAGCSRDCEEDQRWTQPPPTWDRTASSDSSKLHPNSHRPSRLAKVESYECRDTLRANSLRSSVSKSYSFGGYDQTTNNRVLTKQDSGSSAGSRVSPSSSGYKSQSQRSDATLSATPSPSATPHLTTQLSNQSGALSPDIEQETVFWAVTNMASVPVGSILINPHTGQPIRNDDGTLYHYNPDNPPKTSIIVETNAETTVTSQSTAENERKLDSGCCSSASGVSQSEPSGASDLPPTTSKLPTNPPSSSYQHQEEVRLEPESGGSMVPITQIQYQQVPPPPPTAPMPHVATNTSTMSMMYNPSVAPYMQPPSVEGYVAPTNSQHFMYAVPYNPPLATHQQYAATSIATMPQQHNTLESQEYCSYLAGLSQGDVSRPENQHRQIYYCQPHYSQGATTGATGPPMQTIFFANPNPTAPQAHPAGHQPRFAPCTLQYPQQERTVAPECSYMQPGVHGYYSRCAPAQQAGSSIWNPTALALICPPVHTQTGRPFPRMATPPNTNQNQVAQFPMNNYHTGLLYPQYPTTHSSTQPQIPMPQSIMRPALQINMANSPPLRAIRPAGYNTAAGRSPGMREAVQTEPPRHTAGYAAQAVPANPPLGPLVYRLNYPSTEYVLMNNNRNSFPSGPQASRLPPSVPFPTLRRNRADDPTQFPQMNSSPKPEPIFFRLVDDNTPVNNFSEPEPVYNRADDPTQFPQMNSSPKPEPIFFRLVDDNPSVNNFSEPEPVYNRPSVYSS